MIAQCFYGQARRWPEGSGPPSSCQNDTSDSCKSEEICGVGGGGGKGLASDPTLDPLSSTIPAAAHVYGIYFHCEM